MTDLYIVFIGSVVLVLLFGILIGLGISWALDRWPTK